MDLLKSLFITILLLFYLFIFLPQGMQDLSIKILNIICAQKGTEQPWLGADTQMLKVFNQSLNGLE